VNIKSQLFFDFKMMMRPDLDGDILVRSMQFLVKYRDTLWVIAMPWLIFHGRKV